MYTDYVKRFLNYSTLLLKMAKSVWINAFVTDLEPVLQVEVKSRYPITMRETQLVKDRNLALKMALNELGGSGPSISEAQTQTMKDGRTNTKKKGGRQTEYPMRKISILVKGSYTRGEPPVRFLSDNEFKERLDKGLCFCCNDKYSHGHIYKIKENRYTTTVKNYWF
ncbi:hypothetical protein IC575_009252 [Cucumis melo]